LGSEINPESIYSSLFGISVTLTQACMVLTPCFGVLDPISWAGGTVAFRGYSVLVCPDLGSTVLPWPLCSGPTQACVYHDPPEIEHLVVLSSTQGLVALSLTTATTHPTAALPILVYTSLSTPSANEQ
jgi:hypothetical protein